MPRGIKFQTPGNNKRKKLQAYFSSKSLDNWDKHITFAAKTMDKRLNDVLLRNVSLLSKLTEQEVSMMPAIEAPLPSVEQVKEIVRLVKTIIFPDYFNKRQPDETIRSYYIGVHMEELLNQLTKQIAHGLQRLLYTDVQAMFDNDPAAPNYGEVIFCYPVVNTMTHYRIAHKLHELKVPVIPRIITEQAHSKTGIDIHPGAQIGEYFAIDHGTGVVIGETCIIGNHVTLYQGVTLGAKSFKYDEQGNMLNVPRHPIIEDYVTVYSNASILGRITIGHHSTIGGNIWLTHDVAPHSRILQSKAVDVSFNGGLGI